jgi:hypothetical protein
MTARDGQLSMGDLAAAVVAADDDLRDDLKKLVADMIRHMRWTMRHGEPSAKTQLSKQIMPQLLKAINKVDTDESEKEERAAYERMMAALRGDVIPADAIDTTPQASEDAPALPSPAKKKPAAKKVPAKRIAVPR